MSKHTPGPWKADGNEIMSEGQESIASLSMTNNQEGNLPLIAAAPELLEVCKEALKVAYNQFAKDDDRDRVTRLMARVIEKAEGK